MSITARVIIGFCLVVAAGFYFFLNQFVDRVRRQYLEAAEEPMVDAAHVLAEMAAEHFHQGKFDDASFRAAFSRVDERRFEARIYNLVKREVGMEVYVTDARGIVLFDSAGIAEGKDYSRFLDVALTLQGKYGARASQRGPAGAQSGLLYVAAPILLDGGIAGVLTVSKAKSSMESFIDETRRRMKKIGWLVAVGIMLAGLLLSQWLTRPIRRLIAYAGAVRERERVALPQLGRSEIGALGRAFEAMRDELEGRQYVEGYVQTLTHAMKSPVAAIRGAAELLDEEMPRADRARFLENIRAETHRLQNFIDQLLALVALESRKAITEPAELRLRELLDEACEEQASAIVQRGLTLTKRYEDDPVVCGEAYILEMALANLLQNAIDFSPSGGEIIVGLEARDGHATITISDEGPGIPEYARERVFERFYSLPRPESGKKSSGLGLCFVREAADLHGGSAMLENRDSTGARALLRIPATEEKPPRRQDAKLS